MRGPLISLDLWFATPFDAAAAAHEMAVNHMHHIRPEFTLQTMKDEVWRTGNVVTVTTPGNAIDGDTNEKRAKQAMNRIRRRAERVVSSCEPVYASLFFEDCIPSPDTLRAGKSWLDNVFLRTDEATMAELEGLAVYSSRAEGWLYASFNGWFSPKRDRRRAPEVDAVLTRAVLDAVVRAEA